MSEKTPVTPKENQPEYAWKSEAEKHFLRVTRYGSDGVPYWDSQEYTPHPKGYSTPTNVNLLPGDKKVTIEPYKLQVFTNKVALKTSGGTIDELLVGVIDGQSTSFISVEWTTEEGRKRVNQFFFDKDRPSSCNLGMFQGPWPTNRPAIITPEMRPYMSALREIVPTASSSLANCINTLALPGPEFTLSDKSIKINTRQRN